MDDTLEVPTTITKPLPAEERPEEDEQSSGDEDEGPDWTRMPSASRPVIPKRGEKDFEPLVQGGSGLQRHVLDRARSAMFDALGATRTTSSKSISYGVWYPNLARAHVTTARGIHFTNMGHSVLRAPPSDSQDVHKVAKRLELLPEEALYLVERGAMFCWKATDVPTSSTPGLEEMEGAPMSVQQAFAEMIGLEDLTLEKYQVYAYLKRLGYVVMRTKPPSAAYPLAAPFKLGAERHISPLRRAISSIWTAVLRLFRKFSRGVDWWHPLRFNHWLHHNMDYPSVFRSLRFLPAGHDVPLHIKKPQDSAPSPYQIFYNLYKPSTPFKKTAPPAPDFSVVVVNARTTPMPTISELSALFDVLPELPPPTPRRRQPPPGTAPTPALANNAIAPATESQGFFLRRIFPWAFPARPELPAARKPNPFAMLKAGKKMVVIAVVDAGTISFFRFGQGVFTEFPMN